MASTNGAPVVAGLKNSEGRHLWWGVPGRTLEGVLTYLEGGNEPLLAYPPDGGGRHGHGSPPTRRAMVAQEVRCLLFFLLITLFFALLRLSPPLASPSSVGA